MKIYTQKSLKYGFAILCPSLSIGLLQNTVQSLKARHPNAPFLAVVDGSATTEDLVEIKKYCPVYKAKSTISSLLNVGMRHATSDWVFSVFAGTTVRWSIDEKFAFFVQSEKDILFPIAERKMNFIDGTLNGLFINKKFFREVGDFEDEGELEHIKLIWADKAMSLGCRFKAIIGAKLC